MKKFSKLKYLLAGIMVCFAMLILPACQKDVNISKIEVKEGTLPETITVGKFDEAGIKLVITYEDKTTNEVAVTSQMVEGYEDYLTTPGSYTITILFKGYSTEIDVTMVSATTRYLVKFYDAYGYCVSQQYIEEGEDAEAPSEEAYTIQGYNFVGWDRTFTDISEPTNIYGIYTKVDQTEEQVNKEEMQQTLATAIDYLYTHDSVRYGRVEYVGQNSYDIMRFNNHYNNGVMTGQTIGTGYSVDGQTTTISNKFEELTEKGFEMYSDSGYYASILWKNMSEGAETQEQINEQIATTPDIQYLKQYLNSEFAEYSTVFVNGETLYEFYIKIENEIKMYVIFDDTNILSSDYTQYFEGSEEILCSMIYEYKTIEFIENPIPLIGDINQDGAVTSEDIELINAHIDGTSLLPEEQQLIADVDKDGRIGEMDIDVIEEYIEYHTA